MWDNRAGIRDSNSFARRVISSSDRRFHLRIGVSQVALHPLDKRHVVEIDSPFMVCRTDVVILNHVSDENKN